MPTPFLLSPPPFLTPFSPSSPLLLFIFHRIVVLGSPLHHPSSPPSHLPITPTPKRPFNEAYSQEREREFSFCLLVPATRNTPLARNHPAHSRCSVAAQLLAFSSTCSSPFSSPRTRGVPVTLAAFNRVARLSFIARLAIDRFPRLSSA